MSVQAERLKRLKILQRSEGLLLCWCKPQIAIEFIKVLDHTLSWSRNFILFVDDVQRFEAI